MRKLPDYLGVLRAVVFCTEDLQLVKGTGRVRRRFLDLLLVADAAGPTLPLLQRYMQALRSRNALLKQRAVDEMAAGELFPANWSKPARKSPACAAS